MIGVAVVDEIEVALGVAIAARVLFGGSSDGRESWRIGETVESHGLRRATSFGYVLV